MKKSYNHYDVLIIGGGVTGTAIFYTLSDFTNVEKVALIEKHPDLALVNSHHKNNSQTLHFGDIETNYTVEKAKKVKAAADLVAAYVEKNGEHMYKKFQKMVLAVGEDEIEKLKKRHDSGFSELFPKLRWVEKKEIEKLEPKIVEGRNPKEKIAGVATEEGFAINYKALADSFVEKAVRNKKKQNNVFLETRIIEIKKIPEGYHVKTNKGDYSADKLVVAAGSHSIKFAYSLGYAKDWIILPVAGSFFCAPKQLNGKVYTLQMEKLPFAAIHGDPSVTNPNETRFGPIAKVLPMLERYRYETVKEFADLFEFRISAFASIFKILSDPIIFKYILREFIYDMPFIGRRSFLKQIRKIVPSLQLKDLMFAKGVGGIRPQVVDVKEKKLIMGEGRILGKDIIFNITPSPGASTCLKNAENDVKQLMEFFDGKFKFDHKKFVKELSRNKKEEKLHKVLD